MASVTIDKSLDIAGSYTASVKNSNCTKVLPTMHVGLFKFQAVSFFLEKPGKMRMTAEQLQLLSVY